MSAPGRRGRAAQEGLRCCRCVHCRSNKWLTPGAVEYHERTFGLAEESSDDEAETSSFTAAEDSGAGACVWRGGGSFSVAVQLPAAACRTRRERRKKRAHYWTSSLLAAPTRMFLPCKRRRFRPWSMPCLTGQEVQPMTLSAACA